MSTRPPPAPEGFGGRTCERRRLDRAAEILALHHQGSEEPVRVDARPSPARMSHLRPGGLSRSSEELSDSSPRARDPGEPLEISFAAGSVRRPRTRAEGTNRSAGRGNAPVGAKPLARQLRKVTRAPLLGAVALATSEEIADAVSTTRCDVRLPLQLSTPLPPSSEEPLASGVEGIEFRETFSSHVGETEAETNRHSLALNIEARKAPSRAARKPSCSEEHSGPWVAGCQDLRPRSGEPCQVGLRGIFPRLNLLYLGRVNLSEQLETS